MIVKLKHQGHRTRLNKQCKADINWWLDVIDTVANGLKLEYILYPKHANDVTVWIDATSHGIGGYSSTGKWLQYQFTNEFSDNSHDIKYFELLAIVVAANLWYKQWYGKAITFYSDNITAVYNVAKRTASLYRPDLLTLVRQISDLSIKNRFHFVIFHIAGTKNITADKLSRFKNNPFASLPDDVKRKMDKQPTDCVDVVDNLIHLNE